MLANLSDFSEEEAPPSPPYRTGSRRRRAAIALALIWSSTIALHLLTWGSWLVMGLTTLMGIHAVRILFARPLELPKSLDLEHPDQLPFVSVLVAAKNEEAVIGRLVKAVCDLEYPSNRYELWVINDNSTDQTAAVLDQLAEDYDQLRVFHRAAGAGGGKSGALNQVLPLTKGEVLAVFDADAQVTPDLFRRVLPMFTRSNVGAVQVRKAIANVSKNGWIRGQTAEMALDSYFQQQRIAVGGIGELRGNGQFVRRAALHRCGGWNEETITDDLDLTIRLHLDRWDIEFMTVPAVGEEGVTRVNALWHQRNRWAEGGYQRYLDYWQPILRNRMGTRKTLDLFMFWMSQYVLPTATVPDAIMAVVRNSPMLLSPIASLMIMLSLVGMVLGLRRVHHTPNLSGQPLPNAEPLLRGSAWLRALYGTLYMLHWFPVVASATARMAVRPKRLKWVKTAHHGDGSEVANAMTSTAEL